tara:strand:+ start:2281 stop:3132 length:852 start_codon:yes stop_codon:yes gene_type:complete
MKQSNFYICPITKEKLTKKIDGYKVKKNFYKIIKQNNYHTITDFIKKHTKTNFYSEKVFYKNYLSWLSKTLIMSMGSIRREIFADIKFSKNKSILFIGCGFGDEIKFFIKKYRVKNNIYAQDISKNMVIESSNNLKNHNIEFSISNACNLPYKNNFFDFVFHFGGFNEFKRKKKSLFEINRVAKNGGTILISDEGMGPWLSKTERYKALKFNNSLWSYSPPLSILPIDSSEVKISWILKNNFYKILYKKKSSSNKINYNVLHKSPRGGSIKSRYEKYFKKKLK